MHLNTLTLQIQCGYIIFCALKVICHYCRSESAFLSMNWCFNRAYIQVQAKMELLAFSVTFIFECWLSDKTSVFSQFYLHQCLKGVVL